MSKGKRKDWNKPVIDNRKGLAKLKPIEPTIPGKPVTIKIDKAWKKGINSFISPSIQRSYDDLVNAMIDHQKMGYVHIQSTPMGRNMFLQEYPTEPEKVPTLDDWVDRWYEENS